MPERSRRSSRPVRVAVVGLGFGENFLPIYKAHPAAELAVVCQRGPEALTRVQRRYEVPRAYADFDDVLADPDIDAVHLNTPIPLHAGQAIRALEAGKHVACTVPMATSIEECQRVVAAQRDSGRVYMMMETGVYTREFLHARELKGRGGFGDIQLLRGAHIQDMSGAPDYWRDLAPMHYATHVIGPLFALADSRGESVICVVSGTVAHDPAASAVEIALFRLHESASTAEVTRSLFDLSREYVESFSVYGDQGSFEWQQLATENPVFFSGEHAERFTPPDFAARLPSPLRPFTSGPHGGSHPHLVHEFISAILEAREPFPDAPTAANWTAAGIAAHVSATSGERVTIPSFTDTEDDKPNT